MYDARSQRGEEGGRALIASGAELHVVDVLGDRRVLAADRAVRVAPERDLRERRAERVEQLQPPDQRVADLEHELQRLARLERADMPGSTPSTPPSAHDGASSGGGGVGKRQR